MSKKNLLEAIGDIETDFLEEYSSYVPKQKVKVYTVMKALAACLAMILCTGAVLAWVGNDHSSQKNQRIVANQDKKDPDHGNNVNDSSPLPEASSKPETDKVTQPPVVAEVTTSVPEVTTPVSEVEASQQPSVGNEATVMEKNEENKQNHNVDKYDINNSISADSTISNESGMQPVQTPGKNENFKEDSSNQAANQGDNKLEVNDGTETPDSGQNTEDLESNEQKPDGSDDNQQSKPSDSENVVTASNWNQVKRGETPCSDEIIELECWRKEYSNYIKNYQESTTNDPTKNNPVTNQKPNAFTAGMVTAEKNGIRWNTKRLEAAPVLKGWYWFDTELLTWDKQYILQRDKNKENALSNVLLFNGGTKLYIIQTKTTAKSLEEANTMYPEEIFSGNLNVTNFNGIPVYLVENSTGELYARFLIEDTFITIINKGFGKEVMCEMLANVKVTF